jgi:ketosteroid isomerase-like protein
LSLPAEIADKLAIQDLLNRYSDGCSRQDWAQVMDGFLPDGAWQVNAMPPVVGHAAMQAAMAGFVAQMDYWVQLNTPAIIAVDGDKATARTTIRECGRFKDRDEAVDVSGFYIDEIVRTAAGWKFAAKRFTSAGAIRFPLAPGPALG